MKIRLSCCVLICLAAQSAGAQSFRRLSPADILRIPAVADPQISADGENVAYTVSTVEDNETRTAIWIARPYARFLEIAHPSDAPHRLLPADWTASNPRWSPDGRRIAFLSRHD